MNNKSILEIQVDRQNEKWSWAFEHILIILHKILEKRKPKYIFGKNVFIRPEFSFEIAKIWNKIRFFVVVENKYKDFLRNQIYAHYSDVEITDANDYLSSVPDNLLQVWEIIQEKHFYYQIKNFTQLQEASTKDIIDPYSSITASLSKTGNNTLNVLQINFSPADDSEWKKKYKRIIDILLSKYPYKVKKFLLKYDFSFLKIFVYPFYLIIKLFSLIIPKHQEEVEKKEEEDDEEWEIKETSKYSPFKEKLDAYWYHVSMNIIWAWLDVFQNKVNIKETFSTLWVYSYPGWNGFKLINISNNPETLDNIKKRKNKQNIILNTKELSWLVHFPTTYVKTPSINWVLSRNFEPPSNLPIIENTQLLTENWESVLTNSDLTPIWETNFRWEKIQFWVWPNDRRRHMYIIWKTWMWKSTLLENMILDDIKKGRGVAVIDPHGDLAEAIIWNIPKSRTNQTIIFDPSDTSWPIAFNMLDEVSPEHRSLVASGLVWIFKKIFWDSWWPRLEYILRNTVLALLEVKWSTLISIPIMLTNDLFRYKVVSKLKDPVVKKFWETEYNKMSPTQKTEAAWPILNKVWQFLSSTILRNILGQPKNSFDIRWAMDNSKIIIINLSKWKIWEDASSLLWAMMVTKFQMDAMSRADILEKDRRDFYLYVDEFQNFATDSFATILSEARKYKLNLVMANQYIDQMTESVKWAVFWNVWSIVSFQVWFKDAAIMKEVFWTDINVEDLTNLKKYSIYTKLLIDWMPSKLFSANTFWPHNASAEVFETRYKKILQVSREKYAKPKDLVEEKINKTINDSFEDFPDKKDKEQAKKK